MCAAVPDLVAVGEVLLDVLAPSLAAGSVTHAPIRVRAGGVPVNAAVAATRSGARAFVVGRIGGDEAGAAVRDGLERASIAAHLVEDSRLPTGTFVLGGDAIAADRGATAGLRPPDIPSPLVGRSVLVSGHVLFNDETCAAAVTALDDAGGRPVAVVAASARSIARVGAVAFRERTAGATCLFANAEEARALTGLGPLEAAAELAAWFRIVCVTDGGGGAYAVCDERLTHRRAATLTSGAQGAGDALAGVMLASLARGAESGEAFEAGCRAAEEWLTSSAVPGDRRHRA